MPACRRCGRRVPVEGWFRLKAIETVLEMIEAVQDQVGLFHEGRPDAVVADRVAEYVDRGLALVGRIHAEAHTARPSRTTDADLCAWLDEGMTIARPRLIVVAD